MSEKSRQILVFALILIILMSSLSIVSNIYFSQSSKIQDSPVKTSSGKVSSIKIVIEPSTKKDPVS